MEAVHALKITEEAVGTWEQADIASKDYRVRVQIGSDEAKTTYDRLAGAFVTEAVQENEAGSRQTEHLCRGRSTDRIRSEKGICLYL